VPGAALLAGTAALRTGAGRVQIATIAEAALPLAPAIPEARLIGLATTESGEIDPASAPAILSFAQRCDALLVGPGMLDPEGALGLACAMLAEAEPAGIVLDAAALPGLLDVCGQITRHAGRMIVTPHAGEMAQLLGRSREAIEADPLGAAREAASRLQAVVIMKGAQTHIVSPAGAAWLFTGGNVGLATGGSGDILAGILAALLARGANPVQAALWGVYLHGEAGARLARRIGPLGYLARELAAEIPGILAEFAFP
jgi:hydroxyethylthiazole kinase-like uncharacterized protein yjeF